VSFDHFVVVGQNLTHVRRLPSLQGKKIHAISPKTFGREASRTFKQDANAVQTSIERSHFERLVTDER
jgi:hypothetical protein